MRGGDDCGAPIEAYNFEKSVRGENGKQCITYEMFEKCCEIRFGLA